MISSLKTYLEFYNPSWNNSWEFFSQNIYIINIQFSQISYQGFFGATGLFKTKINLDWAPVAHACNPSYLGGRDQEDQGWNWPWANSLQDPILKKTITTKVWRRGSSVQSTYLTSAKLWVQTPMPPKLKLNLVVSLK
jgi:hypothetical protein